MAKASKKSDQLRPCVLNPRQVLEVMVVADEVGDSLMMWGAPGIGKSNIAIEYANTHYPLRKNNLGLLEELKSQVADPELSKVEQIAAQNKLNKLESALLDQETNFIDFRLSQIEPSDLRGIPIPERVYRDLEGKNLKESDLKHYEQYIAETVLVWAAPKVLKLEKGWKGVILFDEINSAMPIVQAASYQLILDRCVGELRMPDGAFILAAGNRDTDGGVTFPLATPLRDRMTHVEMEPNLEQFIEDFAVPNKVAPEIIAFLKEKPSVFNTLSSDDPSQCGGSSPRSWVRLSDYVKNGKVKGKRDMLRTLAAGRVGTAIAVEFEEYMNSIDVLPKMEDIMSGKTKTLASDLDISHHYFITLSLTMHMANLHREFKAGTVEQKDYTERGTNYIEFLDNNFGKHSQDLVILAIRSLSAEKVMLSYATIPVFKQFVEKYSQLIAKTRNMA